MKAKIDLKKTIPILTITILLISTIAFMGIPVSASPDVEITPVTTDIDADTYKTKEYTEVSSIVITEGAVGDIAEGDFVLTIPDGFEFDTNSVPDVAVTAAVTTTNLVAETSATITTSNITVSVTTASSGTDNEGVLTIGGATPIKARPTAGTPLATGNIVMTSGTIAGVTIGTTNFGTLNEVPGALHHFTMTGYPSSCLSEIAWTTPDDDVTVKAYDQYGNPATNYVGAVIWTSTDTATDKALPAKYTFTTGTGTDKDNGVHTFPGSNFKLVTVGTQTITVADTTAEVSLTSSPITVRAFATVSPSLVAGSKTRWFDITVTNIVSEASIYKTEIIYPAWTFVDVIAPTGWLREHNPTSNTVIFTATGGYEISPDGSAVFKFKMTTAASGADYPWKVTGTDTADEHYIENPDVTVDVEEPSVSVTAPVVPYYSIGAGNYLWLNLTVTDNVKKLPSVYVNDTRFELYKTPTAVEAESKYDFEFCYVNKTAIPDGLLPVWFNVTDYVGNWCPISSTPPTGFPEEISAYVDKTVDNTAPFILIDVKEGTSVDSVFYIGEDITSVTVNVTVADYGLVGVGPLTGIYVNDTLQTWEFLSTGKKYKGYPVWECTPTLATPAAYNLWILNVNATDTALPSNHTSRMEVRISRDLESPYEIGFTSAEAICGGVIIRGLYAKDLVGVMDYTIYVNGTITLTTITELNLKSTTWALNAFNSIAVLNLTAYVGDFVNITVIAEDFGLNPSDEIVLFTGVVPEGEWYPVELYKGWNLVSLPLIPNSTASADVLSLVLEQGATGVSHVYEYDQLLDSWIIDPAKIEDGKGYWFYMTAYDVLIVSGSKMPPGGGIPPTYTLTEGWVLAGFKSTADMEVSEYLASVRNESYFKIIYIWNAADQVWGILNRDEAADKFTPGQGFWILMYEEEVLVPPTA